MFDIVWVFSFMHLVAENFIFFFTVAADEVDRVAMQKPAIAVKKPGLATALKRPAAGIRLPSASSSGNIII